MAMAAKAIKRHTIHLDVADMRTLTRLARAEAKATGISVTAAGIIRRLNKRHLREHQRLGGKP